MQIVRLCRPLLNLHFGTPSMWAKTHFDTLPSYLYQKLISNGTFVPQDAIFRSRSCPVWPFGTMIHNLPILAGAARWQDVPLRYPNQSRDEFQQSRTLWSHKCISPFQVCPLGVFLAQSRAKSRCDVCNIRQSIGVTFNLQCLAIAFYRYIILFYGVSFHNYFFLKL